MKLTIIFVVCILFTSPSAFSSEEITSIAGATDSKAVTDVICSNKTEKRTLVIVREGTGCKVNYTKGETVSVIGSQKKGTDNCISILEKVKTKLIAASFVCE